MLKEKFAGTQSISRALAVLRVVADAGEGGIRMTDVATELALSIGTARRLLQALAAEGLLLFDVKAKTYQVGAGLIGLAVKASSAYAQCEHSRPAVMDVAAATGDTVCLLVRRGHQAVCLARIEGVFPIRVMTLDVGSIRPLGAGSGSLALLAFQSDEERAAIIARNASEYPQYHLTAAKIEELVRKTRARGYAVNPGLIIPGMVGIAVPVYHGASLVASINVMAIESRFPPKRQREVYEIVKASVAKLPMLGTSPVGLSAGLKQAGMR